MGCREIVPNVYHKFLSGVIYGQYEVDGTTVLTVWQATLRIGTDFTVPFLVEELAATHLYGIAFGSTSHGEELIVFRLTDCETIYRIIYDSGVFEVITATVKTSTWNGQISMDLNNKFMTQKRIAAMEVACFYVEPQGKCVFTIFVDVEPFPGNLSKTSEDKQLLKKAFHVPIEAKYKHEFLSNETVMQIDSGTDHVVVLSNKGRIFVFGHHQRGELGLSEKELTSRFKKDPMEFTLLSSMTHKFINRISCGFWHNLALSTDGQIFGWGWNRHGQINPKMSEFLSVPCELPNITEEGDPIVTFQAEMDGTSLFLSDPTLRVADSIFTEHDPDSPEPGGIITYGNTWDHWLP